MTKKEAWQRIHDHCLTNGLFWYNGEQPIGLCGMLHRKYSPVDVGYPLREEMEEDLALFTPDSYDSAWWAGPRGQYTPLRQTIVEFLIAMS